MTFTQISWRCSPKLWKFLRSSRRLYQNYDLTSGNFESVNNYLDAVNCPQDTQNSTNISNNSEFLSSSEEFLLKYPGNWSGYESYSDHKYDEPLQNFFEITCSESEKPVLHFSQSLKNFIESGTGIRVFKSFMFDNTPSNLQMYF